MPELPHMLGIVPIGAISTPEAEEGTILDPSHEFWNDYYEDINTENGVKREIADAIQSLKDDGLLEIRSPYGEDAGIMYVEVDTMASKTGDMEAKCIECGGTLSGHPELVRESGDYSFLVTVECNCGFKKTIE